MKIERLLRAAQFLLKTVSICIIGYFWFGSVCLNVECPITSVWVRIELSVWFGSIIFRLVQFV